MVDLESGDKGMTEGLTNIDRVRLALAMADAGYSWEIEIEYVEELLSAFDALTAQPEYLSGCQLRGPGECHSHGMCQSMACRNAGKIIVKRVCVEAKEAGIVYPNYNQGE